MKPDIDCGELLAEWKRQSSDKKMAAMAENLGVSVKSLSWMNAVLAEDRGAFAFPMYDATCLTGENPCGIRLRTPDGKKFAVTGSKAGVFYPYGAMMQISSNRVFICEGPTDAAACLDLGLFVIGRAACRGQEEIILSALEQISPYDCVVISDNDGPGIEGAKDLLKQIPIPKTLFVPPGKDLRAFVRDGGTKELIDSMLKNVIRR